MPSLIGLSAEIIIADFLPGKIPMTVVVFLGTLGNPAILSSVGARLLINMKEAGAKGLSEGMGSSAGSRATVSGLDFAAPPRAQASGFSCGNDEIETVDV